MAAPAHLKGDGPSRAGHSGNLRPPGTPRDSGDGSKFGRGVQHTATNAVDTSNSTSVSVVVLVTTTPVGMQSALTPHSHFA